MEQKDQKTVLVEKILPVTVLSGFLGAGKTTLLKHILENKQDLKCALIVNDMAEINVDSALIKDSQLVKSEEKMISMQNGCICCTLREDLLIQVAQLAKQNQFDYLIIESTGISEPIQVAETFSFDLPEDEADKQVDIDYLKNYAKLDTCVTVVDAHNFFTFFNTEQSLTEKFPEEKPEQEDERTVTELMIDQLEFANVIILNKTDLVDKKELEDVKQMVRKLNKDAKIIESSYSKVDLKEIINTQLFDMEKAKQNEDWLAQDRYNFTPETIEFGITSFVYKQKRPFDNKRLHTMLKNNFYLDLDPRHLDDKAFAHDHDDEDEHDHEHDHTEEEQKKLDEQYEKDMAEALIKYKKDRTEGFEKKNAGLFKDVWRSKGFFWIAGNKKEYYLWSQSGIVNKVNAGGIFGCEFDEETIAQIPEYKELSAKFDPVTGDRETNIVFIGKKINKDKISELLDSCLLDEKEFKQLVDSNLELDYGKEDAFFHELEDEEEKEKETKETDNQEKQTNEEEEKRQE